MRRRFAAGSPLSAVAAVLLCLGLDAAANDAAIWRQLIPADSRAQEIAAIRHSRTAIAHIASTEIRQLGYADTVPSLNGTSIRIPGYIVPVGLDGEKVVEFLLVPYFGACIHVPPPPANQIIHVHYKPGIRGFDLEQPYWIAGVLETGTGRDGLEFEVGYRIASATEVEPYSSSAR